MDNESVMLSVRVPSHMKRNFSLALKRSGKTTAEVIRDSISKFNEEHLLIPALPKINPAERAREFLNGKVPYENTALYLNRADRSDYVLSEAVINAMNKHPEMPRDIQDILIGLSVQLQFMSHVVVQQDEKLSAVQRSIEDAQNSLNGGTD